MADHIIDTNVLLVASAAEPFSPFQDSDLPAALQESVFEWLMEFRRDPSRQMVWDDLWKIYNEYRHKLTEQDYGLQVVKEKMATVRLVPIQYDDGGVALVPGAFASFDPSDRKFLAVLLEDPEDSSLVNATDTDWLAITAEVDALGCRIEFLLEKWLKEKHAEKTGC